MEKLINNSPVTIQQSIEEIKSYLLEKEKRLNTIKSYSQDINHFHSWIKQRTEPTYLISSLTTTDLRDYASARKSVPTSASATVKRRLVTLIRWSEFLSPVGSPSINISK